MDILIPVLVAILGLVIYLASANAKATEVGRLMFAIGLLVVLLAEPFGRAALHLTR